MAKGRNFTSEKDIAAFTKDSSREAPRVPLTANERGDHLFPKPLVKILNYGTGTEVQASLSELNEQMQDFDKVILLIEDTRADSDMCAAALHTLGYNGVQLITHLAEAINHLDDIVSALTVPPAAIVLDLGLGVDSGFAILRMCHAEPRLQKVPILVWTKHADDMAQMFSNYLGAQDFLVKSNDPEELQKALNRLLLRSPSDRETTSAHLQAHEDRVRDAGHSTSRALQHQTIQDSPIPIHWYCDACGWEMLAPAERPDPEKIPTDVRSQYDRHLCKSHPSLRSGTK
jgi:DNA-binding response OmpR family regulator